MTKIDPVLKRLREICLALPDTKETLTWGKPHFRVGEKTFTGYGEERGTRVIGVKLEMAHADAVVEYPHFWRAPDVGKHGWVSTDTAHVDDWDAITSMIHESYRLIAPKRNLAKMESVRTSKRESAAGTREKKRKTRKNT